MSLLGRKSALHPQQSKAMTAAERDAAGDDRSTPQEFVDQIAEKLGIDGFEMDPCASEENHKAPNYHTIETDGLASQWSVDGRPASCFVNPPFSDLATWIAKAAAEWAAGNCSVIAMLLPDGRHEQEWWTALEAVRDMPGSPVSTHYVRGRLRFTTPGGFNDPRGSRPSHGVLVVVWASGPIGRLHLDARGIGTKRPVPRPRGAS